MCPFCGESYTREIPYGYKHIRCRVCHNRIHVSAAAGEYGVPDEKGFYYVAEEPERDDSMMDKELLDEMQKNDLEDIMTKYYDIYTQIPGINPCPQMWVVESNAPDRLMSFNNGLMHVENIVGTTVREIYKTKTLICRQEYFICCLEAWHVGDDE